MINYLEQHYLNFETDLKLVQVEDIRIPCIKKIIFNEPATIVIWSDKTKTISKVCKGDIYDKKTGLCVCIAKKALGGNGKINKLIKNFDNK